MTFTNEQKLLLGIFLGIGVGVIVLLYTLFHRTPSINQDLINQLIAAKDSVIKAQNDNIALHERLIEEKDKTNDALQDRDSILNAHYLETEQTYKRINETIKNIPARITRISGNADSIARAFSEF